MAHSPIRTAIVGFGLSGRVFHAPFMHHSDHFELAAIAQRTSQSSQKEYPSVKAVNSLQEIVDDPSIELVVVATPNPFHLEMALQVLQAGKHVIVEKPMATTLAETNQLIEQAERSKRQLFVFHNRRWDGDFLTVQKILQHNMLGEIVEYEAHYDRYKPLLNPKPWKEKEGPASGILFDLGTHIIDQAVCLFGSPKSVTAKLHRQRKGTLIDDSFDLLLDYRNLQVTLKSTLLAKEPRPRYLIYGRQGSFVKYGIDPQEDDMQAGLSPLSKQWGVDAKENWGILNSSLHGLNVRGRVETLPGSYMGFYENVYQVIREDKPMAIPPHSAQVTTAIIECAMMSHQSGKSIPLITG